jgi:hypothetical protein
VATGGSGRRSTLSRAWAGVWSRGPGRARLAAVLHIAVGAGRRRRAGWTGCGLFAAVDGALGIVLLLLEVGSLTRRPGTSYASSSRWSMCTEIRYGHAAV